MADPAIHVQPIADIDASRVRDFVSELWGDEAGRSVFDKWWWDCDAVTVLVAVDTGSEKVVGLCMGVPSRWRLAELGDEKAVSICGWYVLPTYAGRGIGQQLVRAFGTDASVLNALAISDAAIRSFAKLGWSGPFRTRLLLLPLPLLQRARVRPPRNLVRRSFAAAGNDLSPALAEALDRIDAGKPETQVRRQRRAEDWLAHMSCHPERRYDFHVLEQGGTPVGYFVLRPADRNAASPYRLARIHYVTDLVVNSDDRESLRSVFAHLPEAARADAGSLLFCTSNPALAAVAVRQGWLSERTPAIGRRLAAKAPRFMLGGDFSRFDPDRFSLTFADSDVDHNL